MRDIIYTMSSKGLGMTSVTDADGRLAGIVTDGDLRRKMATTPDIQSLTARDVMTSNPVTIGPETLAVRGAGPARTAQDHVRRRHRSRPPGGGRAPPARPLAHRDGLGRRRNHHRGFRLVPAAHYRARGAAPRPGHWQGLGALQAARRAVDRSAQGARFTALRARPELPRLESDRSRHRGAEPGGEGGCRCPGNPHDPRQRLPRTRPGLARDPGAPGAAAAAQVDAPRAQLRAALPRPRLQARRLRGPGTGRVQGSAAAVAGQPVRPALPREAARGTAPVG